MKTLMLKVVSYQPALVMSLLEKGDGRGYHPSASSTSPSWCKCNNCREMPTEDERKCCGYIPKNCVSLEPVRFILAVGKNLFKVSKITLEQPSNHLKERCSNVIFLTSNIFLFTRKARSIKAENSFIML